MRTQTTTLRFERDLTADEQELVRLLGWLAGLALGVAVTIERLNGTVAEDGRRTWGKAVKPVRVEPWKHDDAAGFEERVNLESYHLLFHAGLEITGVVQVECGLEEWRAADRRRFCLPDWKRVTFGQRTGYFVGCTLRDIPVVVVPDGGNAVLRPRWPETNRLVQAGLNSAGSKK